MFVGHHLGVGVVFGNLGQVAGQAGEKFLAPFFRVSFGLQQGQVFLDQSGDLRFRGQGFDLFKQHVGGFQVIDAGFSAAATFSTSFIRSGVGPILRGLVRGFGVGDGTGDGAVVFQDRQAGGLFRGGHEIHGDEAANSDHQEQSEKGWVRTGLTHEQHGTGQAQEQKTTKQQKGLGEKGVGFGRLETSLQIRKN